MQEQIRKCVVNCALVLTSVAVIAAVSDLKRSEQIIRPPEPAVMETAAPEEIVTGVCTFGDCPVVTTTCTTSCTTSCTTYSTVYDLGKVEAVSETYTLTEWDGYDDWSPDYSATYTAHEFCQLGEIYLRGWRWTWYSEKVLPGDGLDIPGRHTSGGYVRDGDGYICLASDVLDYGTVIETPFGSAGRVYDCGVGNDYTVDVYVGW